MFNTTSNLNKQMQRSRYILQHSKQWNNPPPWCGHWATSPYLLRYFKVSKGSAKWHCLRSYKRKRLWPVLKRKICCRAITSWRYWSTFTSNIVNQGDQKLEKKNLFTKQHSLHFWKVNRTYPDRHIAVVIIEPKQQAHQPSHCGTPRVELSYSYW